MSEKEIRETINKLCADLDQRPGPAARIARGVFPFLIGAGLVVTACGDDETSETSSSSSGTTSTSSSGTGGTTSTSGTGGGGGSTSGTGGGGGSTSSGGGSGGNGGEAGSGGEAGGGGMQTDYQAPFPD